MKDAAVPGSGRSLGSATPRPPRWFRRRSECYSCHADHAAVDTTFVQFYPAGVEHAEQRGDSTEGCSVADCWWGLAMTGRDEAADDAGECAFHAGADDATWHALHGFVLGQLRCEAGDSDIEVAVDAARRGVRR